MKRKPRKREIENRLKSELQENILRKVCTNEQIDYFILTQSLKRDRVTILHSIKWLIRNGFIQEKRIDSNHSKSKRIFTPTEKGICYSIAYLDANVDETIKHFGGESELSRYKEFALSVNDYQAREQFTRDSAKLVLELGIFDKDGKQTVEDRRQLFQKGLAYSLVQLTSEKGFDVTKFFKNESMENLKKIITKSEMKEIKQYLSDLTANIGSILETLIKQFD